jgi:nucleoside-diphosphate-sugar epimerase
MAQKNLKILIFGASGMVGQGTLRECLLDDGVAEVKVVGRSKIDKENPKLKQLVSKDLYNLESHSAELTGYDACFFSLGASAVGLNEDEYAKINYDLPIAVAKLLARLNQDMVFTYVSGSGADSSEKGSIMWARIKGKTENELMKLPFKATYMIRLAAMVPKNGETARTWYRFIYPVASPLFSALERLTPAYVTNTEKFGRAMLQLAKTGHEKRIVENKEIAVLAGQR